MVLHLKSLDDLKPGAKKQGRYGSNKRIETSDGKFDSKGEHGRWSYLSALHRTGHISSLERQVVYVLAPSVKHAGDARARPALRYVADFCYRDRDGMLVVEDFKAKGYLTPDFQIKRHLMRSEEHTSELQSQR